MLRFTLVYGTFHFLQKLKLAVRFPYVEAASDQDTAKKPTRDPVATRPPLIDSPVIKSGSVLTALKEMMGELHALWS